MLVRWRAWEVQVPHYDAPSWHLAGYLAEEHCAKVSSAVASVGAQAEEVATKTGRIYALSGPPGVDAHVAELWDAWQRQHGVAVLREVTSDVLDGRQPEAVNLLQRPA